MLKIKFKNSKTIIDAEFSTFKVNGNFVIQLIGNIPKNKSGFEVFRENRDLLGDYTTFTSIYKELENGILFSEKTLATWTPPEPIPEPEPPTSEEIAEAEKQEKIAALQDEIQLLKTQLEATDYKIIKCYEFSMINLDTPYDPESLHEERQLLRNAINAKETELAEINQN